ncbi:unnamed protein product, partial [Didymodactylos carnosus]
MEQPLRGREIPQTFLVSDIVTTLSPSVFIKWKNGIPDLIVKWQHISDRLVDRYVINLDNVDIKHIPRKKFGKLFRITLCEPEKEKPYIIEVVAQSADNNEIFRSDTIKVIVPDKPPSQSIHQGQQISGKSEITECINIMEEESPFYALQDDEIMAGDIPKQQRQKKNPKQTEVYYLTNITKYRALILYQQLLTARSNKKTSTDEMRIRNCELSPHQNYPVKRLPLMAEYIRLRLVTLCRNNDNGDLFEDNAMALKSIHELIKDKLPKAIEEFELLYTKNEKRRQQNEEFNNNLAAVQSNVFPDIPELSNYEMKQDSSAINSDSNTSKSKMKNYYTEDIDTGYDDTYLSSNYTYNANDMPSYATEELDNGFYPEQSTTMAGEQQFFVLDDDFGDETMTQQNTAVDTVIKDNTMIELDDGYDVVNYLNSTNDSTTLPAPITTRDDEINDGFTYDPTSMFAEDIPSFTTSQPIQEENLIDNTEFPEKWKIGNDIQLLFHWIDFICNQHHSIPLEKRVILGPKFYYFDQLPVSRQSDIYTQWYENLKPSISIINPQQYSEIFEKPKEHHVLPFPFDVEYDYQRFITQRHNDKCTLEQLKKIFYYVPTPTLLNQIVRIFAATSSKTPLLLEGRPGVGKTQVVTQVCQLLNKQCERINLSANTSLDQLIGCIISRCNENGRRIFEWQDGKILSALRLKKWILLDELNLAASEVLEGLIPLLYRDTHTYTVPSTGETIETTNILIFATMNPTTIGGGRSKLPRSISNLFTIVQLEDYNNDELSAILRSLFNDDLEEENIAEDHLKTLFNLHTTLKQKINKGQLGRTGGPYEMNLRDLSKFRDIFRGCIKDQIFHYRFFNTDETSEE